jgi:hypothetical protein
MSRWIGGHRAVAEALYRRLEFTTDLARVWDRLGSGWEWIGLTDEREFVLGYPRRSGPATKPPDITITMPGARAGAHGVSVASPVGPTIVRWYPAEAQAREEFARIVQDLERERRSPPTLALVQRIEQDAAVEELYVTPT